MAARTSLVERWQSRLDESERLAANGPAHRLWLPRIYVRIYRFLLSCYGAGDWRADGAQNTLTERMALEDRTDGRAGAAPKSPEQIRSALGAIHEACGKGADPGPLTERHLADDDWIAVASESAHVSPARCVRLLRKHNLTARRVRRGDDTIIVVHASQREQAMTLIKECRETLGTRKSRARWIRATGLGTLFGLALGLPAIAACLTVIRLASRQTTIEPDEIRVFVVAVFVWWLCLVARVILPWRS